MVKVKPGTDEYQKAVFKAKEEIIRLNKGSKMINRAYEENDMLKTKKLLDNWLRVAKSAYYQIELATLIHQSYVKKNSVVITGDGQPVDMKKSMDGKKIELDPWTLQTLVYLREVFGEDIHNFIEISEDEKESEF